MSAGVARPHGGGVETRVSELERWRRMPELPEFTCATAPDATVHKRGLIYVSDGAAGSPVVAFSDGTDWLRVDTLAAISP